MYRKTQLASGKSSHGSVGARPGSTVSAHPDVQQAGGINMAADEDGGQLEEWAGKTHRTIGSIKRGGAVGGAVGGARDS